MPERSLAETGEMVARRRDELGLTQLRLAQLAKVSKRTVTDLERGTRWARPSTRTRIESVLGWPDGAIEAVRVGETLSEPQASGVVLAELDHDALWALIETRRLDAVRHQEALALYEQRQAALLPERLARLSRRGLMATSRYVAILLEADVSEGFTT